MFLASRVSAVAPYFEPMQLSRVNVHVNSIFYVGKHYQFLYMISFVESTEAIARRYVNVNADFYPDLHEHMVFEKSLLLRSSSYKELLGDEQQELLMHFSDIDLFYMNL